MTFQEGADFTKELTKALSIMRTNQFQDLAQRVAFKQIGPVFCSGKLLQILVIFRNDWHLILDFMKGVLLAIKSIMAFFLFFGIHLRERNAKKGVASGKSLA
jgi:uncharacterized membrane protein